MRMDHPERFLMGHVLTLTDDTVARLQAINPGHSPEATALSIILAVLEDDEAAHAPPVAWTETELRTLRTLRALKMTPTQISVSLGRSVADVREQLRAISA